MTVIAEAINGTVVLLLVPKIDRTCWENVFDGRLKVSDVGRMDSPIVGVLLVTFNVTGIVSVLLPVAVIVIKP